MADYESMYYELFVAVEHAMKNLDNAVFTSRKIYETDKDNAYFTLISRLYGSIESFLNRCAKPSLNARISTSKPANLIPNWKPK